MDDREELLLNRVAERRARPADWDELRDLASADADLWRRLADTLRADDLLAAAFDAELDRHEPADLNGHATAASQGVSLTVEPATASDPVHPTAAAAPRAPVSTLRWGAASGWAAALVLAVTWWSQPANVAVGPTGVGPDVVASVDGSVDGAPSGTSGGVTASSPDVGAPATGAALSADDLLPLTSRTRLAATSTVVLDGATLDVLGTPQPAVAAAFAPGDEDPFVSELPALLVESTTRPDGTREVIYIRRELHAAVVDQLYTMARDDAGRLTPVPLQSDETETF